MLANKKNYQKTNSRGQLPALLILAILTFLQWSPPGFYVFLESLRWYIMAGIAGVVFVLQSRYIKISGARFYILFSVLSWMGALLSLLRTPLPEKVLYYSVSLAV